MKTTKIQAEGDPNPSNSWLTRSDPTLRGLRTKYSITHNPSYAQPGEEVYINLGTLGSTSPVDPNSICLKFSVAKSDPEGMFFNNLSTALVQRLVVSLGGETIYDNSWEGLLKTYTDMWLSQRSREDLTKYGLKPVDLRNPSKTSSKETRLLNKIFNKTKIPIGKILEDQGMICPNVLAENLSFTITLAKSEHVLSKGVYSLSGMEIEYDVINSTGLQLTKAITNEYSKGKLLPFKGVSWLRRSVWNKDRMLVNENINISRACLNQVIMLFTRETRSGSEEFVFPGIENVNVTIRGVPGSVYNAGIKTVDLLTEARKTFDGHMNPKDFFCGDKFAFKRRLEHYLRDPTKQGSL